MTSDGSDRIRKGKEGEIGAVGECVITDRSDSVRNEDGGQRFARIECIISDRCDSLRDCVGGTGEGIGISNEFFLRFGKKYAVDGGQNRVLRRYVDLLEVLACYKRVVANAYDAVGKRDGGQSRAGAECQISDGSNGVRDYNAG